MLSTYEALVQFLTFSPPKKKVSEGTELHYLTLSLVKPDGASFMYTNNCALVKYYCTSYIISSFLHSHKALCVSCSINAQRFQTCWIILFALSLKNRLSAGALPFALAVLASEREWQWLFCHGWVSLVTGFLDSGQMS
jgi:hypothetical protein